MPAGTLAIAVYGALVSSATAASQLYRLTHTNRPRTVVPTSVSWNATQRQCPHPRVDLDQFLLERGQRTSALSGYYAYRIGIVRPMFRSLPAFSQRALSALT